jgi:hypothetical protein
MSYIILRDTFGRGLETISNIGLEVIDEHQLDDFICDAAEITLAEDGYESLSEYEERWDEGANPMGKILVICEVLDKFKGISSDVYIQDVLKNKQDQKDAEEYQLYLKLKEKFEK